MSFVQVFFVLFQLIPLVRQGCIFFGESRILVHQLITFLLGCPQHISASLMQLSEVAHVVRDCEDKLLPLIEHLLLIFDGIFQIRDQLKVRCSKFEEMVVHIDLLRQVAHGLPVLFIVVHEILGS